MRLENKVAIITGADSGIGRATAEAFAQAGADVCITYQSDADGAEETRRLVEAAGRRALALQVDITDTAAVEGLISRTAETLGTPDLFVANAGRGMGGMPVAEMDEGKMTEIFRTDLIGPVLCARAFVNARKAAGGRGRLTFVGSVAGHLPTPGSAPYGMAKAGVNSLVRSLSREVAEDKINVNAITPGMIATEMTQERLEDAEARAEAMKNIPWHRPGEPREIAALAVFLASDDADYVTGQTLVMDGGLTMNWGGA